MQSSAMQRAHGSGPASTSGRLEAEVSRRCSMLRHLNAGGRQQQTHRVVQCASYMRILAKPTPHRPSQDPGQSRVARGGDPNAAGFDQVPPPAASAQGPEAATGQDPTTVPITPAVNGRILTSPATPLQGRMVIQPGSPGPAAAAERAAAAAAAATPASPNPSYSSQLAAQISHAKSFPALLRLWQAHRVRLTPLELAAMFNRLAALTRPEELTERTSEQTRGLLRELMMYSEDCMPDMVGPEFVYIIAALAKLQAAPDPAWLNRWLAVSRVKLSALSPSHLVTCLRALCKLEMRQGDLRGLIAFPAWMHYYMTAVRARMAALSAFDLCRTLTSLADIGYLLDRVTLGCLAAGLETKLEALDSLSLARVLQGFTALSYEPPASFMAAYTATVYQKLPLFDHKDLSIALLALASMQQRAQPGQEFLGDFLQEVLAKLPTFRSSTLGNVLMALAELDYTPAPAWTAAVAEHVQGVMWKLAGPALASAVYGLARCGYQATPAFLAVVRSSSVTKFNAMNGADLVHLGQGLALFGRPQVAVGSAEQRAWQQWYERYCYAVQKRGLVAKQACEVLEVLTLLGVKPDAVVGDHLQNILLARGLEHIPLAHAPHLLTYLRGVGQELRPALLHSYCRALLYNRRSLTPDQWGLVMQQLALVQYRPRQPSWLVYMLAAMQVKVHAFGAGALAAALWGVGSLTRNWSLPSARWRAAFTEQFQGVLQECDAVQLAEGLWGLVQMGLEPSPEFWSGWEQRATELGWALPLAQAQEMVEAYMKVGRVVPDPLAACLAEQQQRWEAEQAAAAAGVAAALADAAVAQQLLLKNEAALQQAGFSAVKGPPKSKRAAEASKQAMKRQRKAKKQAAAMAAVAATSALQQIHVAAADAAAAAGSASTAATPAAAAPAGAS